MSYHIYTTKGIILSSRPLREADRVYAILTRELGLVRATASGVRKGPSKLRGQLEPFALVSVSLVRGKEYWRITSAASSERLPSEAALARPFALLERLVQGEEAHVELFDELALALDPLPVLDPVFETRLAAVILFHLGYLKREDLSLAGPPLVAAINRGIRESGLA